MVNGSFGPSSDLFTAPAVRLTIVTVVVSVPFLNVEHEQSAV